MQGWLCIGAPIVPLHSVMQIYFFHVHIDHFEKKHTSKNYQIKKQKQNKTKQKTQKIKTKQKQDTTVSRMFAFGY